MIIEKFVEVPNTNIQELVTNDFGYDLCYDMAQQYGHAQLVWYALNGTRVVEGEYTDKDYKATDSVPHLLLAHYLLKLHFTALQW